MNNLDTMIQNLTPTVMVPKHEPLQYLSDYGHRFLMASNGVWMESKAPWGHVVFPVRIIPEVSFPYGSTKPIMEINTPNGKIPVDLIRLFVEKAKETPDTEVAAWVIYDSRFQTMRLEMLKFSFASDQKIDYVCPSLSDDESVLMDIHSHATGPAFFSPEDDKDDKGAFRIAVVIGNLDKPDVSVVSRLCMYGMFYDLDAPVLQGRAEWEPS
ncbi:PRTRC system protein A [Methylophilus sp. QUAN]|uniref:PRTRC system protein A n=1 Tax=Methylophilus sp. QUAN TaxID=2781020 RepID=UPI00188EC3D6|nr:PRTRC system protein A [Methylophilus sp. QUAN]MBF4991038.1 PRTRC system protein A [Methylophilus sp. QUAN]